MPNDALDTIDQRILEALSRNARMPLKELAEAAVRGGVPHVVQASGFNGQPRVTEPAKISTKYEVQSTK